MNLSKSSFHSMKISEKITEDDIAVIIRPRLSNKKMAYRMEWQG